MERKLAGAFFGVVTPSFADDYVQEDGISYFANEAEKTATVSHCDTSVSGAVSISKIISFNGESYPVVGIEEYADPGVRRFQSGSSSDLGCLLCHNNWGCGTDSQKRMLRTCVRGDDAFVTFIP